MIKRRDLLKAGVAGAAAATLPRFAAGPARPSRDRPNIVYIFTDQQHAKMMGCAGNPWLKTPAMDYLAANGTRFDRAYTTNPVCLPARIGMMTGHFPGAFGRRHNGGRYRPGAGVGDVARTNIAARLRGGGYDLAYGGKVHLPPPLHPAKLGFDVISTDERDDLAQACAAYIKRRHDRPYYLAASFINPHDICFMAIAGLAYREGRVRTRALAEALAIPPGTDRAAFVAERCPPLPPNHEPQVDEPQAIRWLIRERPFRLTARERFTDQDWRLHRWAYARLTERVDAQIRVILDAVKAGGREENTVVIFSSDHGDNDASFRLEHKTTLNEESANVPFIVMDGRRKEARVDRTHLVSNGLDLLPTVLDYAGVADARGDPCGRSVRRLAEGDDVAWRQHLGVESQIGRMVVGDRYKYVRYDAAGREERLHDLRADPHERTHCTHDPNRAEALGAMRQAFADWFPRA